MQIELKYIECPHCRKWYSYSELLSYSSHGASECWSDGKCKDFNMSEYMFLPYAKCSNCEKFFWTEDSRQLKDHKINDYIKRADESSTAISYEEQDAKTQLVIDFLRKDLEIFRKEGNDLNYPPSHWYMEIFEENFSNDLIELLETDDKLNAKREIYIRTKLVQHINDIIRNIKNPFKQHIEDCSNVKSFFYFGALITNIKDAKFQRKLYKKYDKIRHENLIRLSELLQKNKGAEYENAEITLIEIERELGNFDKAKELIIALDSIDKHNNEVFIKKSLKYIKKKSAKIFIIK